MKTILKLTFIFIVLAGCKEGSKNERIISNSSGNLNNLTIVVDNLLWEDNVGEQIRTVFAAPLEGLPQDEPIFSLSQIPPSVFSGFATKSRIILKIEKGKPAGTAISEDLFAKPQTLVLVTGKTNQEIIDQIESNSKQIISVFKKEEIKEKLRRISLSLHDDSDLKKAFGISIKFPTAYRIAKKEDKFFWIRKDIPTGTMDLMIYEVPLSTIKEGDSTITDIVRMRDSIGKTHIPGPVEGSYMITEESYAPYLFEINLDNKPTYETKGIWDVKNAFMAGPFINYAIKDLQNNRYLVVEGYVFSPSIEKRDHIFEMESIIKSIKFE
ncbi:DUF4837 domain-containing protein [Aquaticitalea lipolytica]|uniref:DUF4837 domain-containing protein n=1 Tax=Aquaticitalea lipolytica TaxID=1247562 RepID=A0A8J2TRG5_9FLAO|nr:DUF4837 family protein [Aquaticitalea lipolytica]GFZ83768.1 DUF4837 domain-containing protein [Aquaticitalea lipolytica]